MTSQNDTDWIGGISLNPAQRAVPAPRYAAAVEVPHATVPRPPRAVQGLPAGRYLAALFLSARCIGPKKGATIYKDYAVAWDSITEALDVTSVTPGAWLKFALSLWQCTEISNKYEIQPHFVCSLKVYNKHIAYVENSARLRCPERIVFPKASLMCSAILLRGGSPSQAQWRAAQQAAQHQQRSIDTRIAQGEFIW
jgi:hypothetical protein